MDHLRKDVGTRLLIKLGGSIKKKYKIEAVEILLVLNFPHLSQVAALKKQTKEEQFCTTEIK